MAEGRARGYEVFDTHNLSAFCDFIAVGKSACCLVEVKSKDGKMHENQVKLWSSLLFPWVWVIARSWEDVEAWFNAH